MPITGQLRKGTHTVWWRAVCADGHPVRGAFAFSVGEPSGTVVVDDLETSQSTAIAFWIVRFLSLLLVLATVGGSVTLAFCLRDASEKVRKRIAGSIALAAGLLVPVSLAGLVLQGSEATGYGVLRAGTLGRPLGGARHAGSATPGSPVRSSPSSSWRSRSRCGEAWIRGPSRSLQRL